MPPLPYHRELLETAGEAQFYVNRWEPAVASGDPLLEAPSIYSLAVESVADDTVDTENLLFETKEQFGGEQVEEFREISLYGGAVRRETTRRFVWDEAGSEYHEFPSLSFYGSTKDPDQLDGLTALEDGLYSVRRDGKVAMLLHIHDDEKTGQSWWHAEVNNGDGTSEEVYERVDDHGRINRSIHDIRGNKYLTEIVDYAYGEDGRLSSETKLVLNHSGSSNGSVATAAQHTEITSYIYMDGDRPVVLIQTRLEDGTVTMTLIRTYDDHGRLVSQEEEQVAPDNKHSRKTSLRAISYKPISNFVTASQLEDTKAIS